MSCPTLAGDSNVARAGAARRRERRLRQWLRHERMTVAAELSAALHHSRDGRQVSHVGLRPQKTDCSWGGRRPGVLEDPGPPQLGVERAACLRSTGLPPLPDLCGGDVHDATPVKFLLRQTLLQRTKEEEERRRKELEQAMKEEKEYEEWHVRLASASQLAQQLLAERSGRSDASSSSRPTRRKKKRKKKKLPKTSSGPLHRQLWHRYPLCHLLRPGAVLAG